MAYNELADCCKCKLTGLISAAKKVLADRGGSIYLVSVRVDSFESALD